ncbi:ribonuclease HII [Mycetocola reblochoni]|uniref:ribonuclease HII n=1 Tax=Mycetocola reblochoni TaxID=331618 RepID=UPI0026840515
MIGCDEVGRGAIAGPVAVGVSVFRTDVPAPDGVRDSKLLSAKRRALLAPLISEWTPSAVGYADPEEIDRGGIVAALGAAAKRALAELHTRGVAVAQATILLDGSADWLSPVLSSPLDVRARVKADRDCISVAAASVVAKVARDELMTAAALRHPGYLWESNKGYGSGAHYAGLAEKGPSPLHRLTWLHERG